MYLNLRNLILPILKDKILKLIRFTNFTRKVRLPAMSIAFRHLAYIKILNYRDKGLQTK